MMRFPSLVAIAALALAAQEPPKQDPPKPAPTKVVYALVVNAENALDLKEAAARVLVRKLFLKDLTQWPDGQEARPYQREADAPAQEAFVTRVLEMSAAELARHWLRVKNMNGTTPPKQVDSDRMVLKYVARNKGAFGIVALDASKDQKDVRVLFTFTP